MLCRVLPVIVTFIIILRYSQPYTSCAPSTDERSAPPERLQDTFDLRAPISRGMAISSLVAELRADLRFIEPGAMESRSKPEEGVVPLPFWRRAPLIDGCPDCSFATACTRSPFLSLQSLPHPLQPFGD